MNWNDLQLILSVAKEGSLSAAARSIGVSHSTVLRRLNAMEERLNSRFFERLASGYELTDAGEAALKAASKIEEQVLDLMGELKGQDQRLEGKIQLTAPEGITHYLLGPLLAEFCQRHPKIQINLNVTATSLAMDRREADLALRATSSPPEQCIGKKICSFNYAVYATPRYLEQAGERPLANYEYVMHQFAMDHPPRSLWKKAAKLSVPLTTTNMQTLVDAVKQGVGAAILPFLVGENEPELQRLSPSIRELQCELWLLTHMDLKRTVRVKALMAHLHEGLLKQASLIEDGE